MKEGQTHGGILGKRGRESQTILDSRIDTIHLNGHTLIPLGYLLHWNGEVMRIQLLKIPAFARRFGYLMLDGIRESAENTGRAFSHMNVKEHIHDRCLYTY